MSRTWLTLLLLAALFPDSALGQAVPTDQAGDPLPTGAVARIGSVRFRPRPYLKQVFFTLDGSAVIGHGGDNVLDFWEAVTGKTVSELRDPVVQGRHANRWGDRVPRPGVVILWDPATAKEVARLSGKE